MKNTVKILALVGIFSVFACKSTKIHETSFWGELEDNQNYLYQSDSLTAIVDGELNSGSVLLFGAPKGDFHEVYVTKIKNKKTKKVKYYLYKPKYKTLGLYSTKNTENLVRATVEVSRSYQTGERGGCYYVNSNGNRIYVDKSFCRSVASSTTSTKTYKSTSSKSSGGDIHVKGHYRKTKSGKTIYVKPHTRKRN